MLFNSQEFLIFLPIVVLIYYLIPNRVKYLWLLVCSYYFYMCWNAKYALLLLFSTATTYASGLLLELTKTKLPEGKQQTKYKKIIVALSFIFNLAVLFFFKYSDFATEILPAIFAHIHIDIRVPEFNIILPVGISFYSFQALSYTMDVYRDEIYAEKNFFRYALFVSFFPQLVAGPIERSKNLLKQLAQPQKFSFERARDGLLLMLWGFFLKIVLADRIAIFVDTVYSDYSIYTGFYILMATILFAVQIYCDFSGYSVIAIGTAEILGVHLMENFNAPYLSQSIAEFWRNWHISLTSWFKDYLYIPLGGNRRGKLRKYMNTMIVFLVSGLWHGASFSFVIWGGLNGFYQILGEMSAPVRNWFVRIFHLNRNSLGHKLFQIVFTFVLVDFSWIFFRAGTYRNSLEIIKKMFTFNPWILVDGSLYTCGLDDKNFRLMLICILVLILADLCKYMGIKIREVVARQDWWFRSIFFVFSICFILTFGIWGPGYNGANFIYFQF